MSGSPQFADELRKLIREFVHELRSPLANVRGYAREIGRDLDRLRPVIDAHGDESLRKVAHEEMRECLEFLQSAGHRMDAALSGISRYEQAERRELQCAPLEPAPVMAQVCSKHFPGVPVCLDAAPAVMADLQGFAQSLETCVRALGGLSAPGGPRDIRFSGSRADSRVRLTIEIPGGEMDSFALDRFFDFYSNFSKEQFGTGTELAMVKRMVERMHGSISIASGDGRNRITVELPAAP